MSKTLWTIEHRDLMVWVCRGGSGRLYWGTCPWEADTLRYETWAEANAQRVALECSGLLQAGVTHVIGYEEMRHAG